MLIRLRGCAGWSASLLFAYGINMFSHDMSELFPYYSDFVIDIWAMSWENLHYAICEQQRHRSSSACVSMQPDQCLFCSLPRKYNANSSYIRNFETLAAQAGLSLTWSLKKEFLEMAQIINVDDIVDLEKWNSSGVTVYLVPLPP